VYYTDLDNDNDNNNDKEQYKDIKLEVTPMKGGATGASTADKCAS
jgi:hypothetical protein